MRPGIMRARPGEADDPPVQVRGRQGPEASTPRCHVTDGPERSPQSATPPHRPQPRSSATAGNPATHEPIPRTLHPPHPRPQALWQATTGRTAGHPRLSSSTLGVNDRKSTPTSAMLDGSATITLAARTRASRAGARSRSDCQKNPMHWCWVATEIRARSRPTTWKASAGTAPAAPPETVAIDLAGPSWNPTKWRCAHPAMTCRTRRGMEAPARGGPPQCVR